MLTTKKIIFIWIVWLVAINLFALFSLNRFNLDADTAYNWIDKNEFSQQKNWNLADLHSRWDSVWHLDIAEHGYEYKGEDALSNIVFFPVYPFLIRILSYVFLGSFVIAGWVVSSVFLLFALIVFNKLISEFFPSVNSLWSIFCLLVFPTAFFFNAIYTESLFLFLSILFFYYLFRKQFLYAGIFGLIASLTRITGVLLFLPFIWELFELSGYKIKQLFNKNLFYSFLVTLGTFAFFLYHKITYGSFLLFFKIEADWGRDFSMNSDHFSMFSNPAKVNFAMDVIFIAFALVSCYFVFKKLRKSFAIYMLATVLIAVSTGTLMSIGRYVLVLFPMFMLGGLIKDEVKRFAWILPSTLLLAMYIILFLKRIPCDLARSDSGVHDTGNGRGIMKEIIIEYYAKYRRAIMEMVSLSIRMPLSYSINIKIQKELVKQGSRGHNNRSTEGFQRKICNRNP